MKVKNFKTKVIGPILPLILMACMHLGDGHHSGDHHSSIRQPSYQYSTYVPSRPQKYSTFLQKMEHSPYLLTKGNFVGYSLE
jgi:hypothetical protein